MDKAAIKEAVIDALAVSLEAQLKALQRLQKGQPEPKTSRKSMSQVDMVYDILQRAAQPLHINEILQRVETVHGQRLDRESIVSSLAKKVLRHDRFRRTGKNTFALKGGA
jgi:hypothetical protein